MGDVAAVLNDIEHAVEKLRVVVTALIAKATSVQIFFSCMGSPSASARSRVISIRTVP